MLEKYLRCLSGILLALMIAVIPIVVVHKMGFMDGPPLSPRKIVVMVATIAWLIPVWHWFIPKHLKEW